MSLDEARNITDTSFTRDLLQARGDVTMMDVLPTPTQSDPTQPHEASDDDMSPPPSPPRWTAAEKGKRREGTAKRARQSPDAKDEPSATPPPTKRFHAYRSPSRTREPPTPSPRTFAWHIDDKGQLPAERRPIQNWGSSNGWTASTPAHQVPLTTPGQTPIHSYVPDPPIVPSMTDYSHIPAATSHHASTILFPDLEQQIAATPQWRPTLHYASDSSAKLGYTKRPPGGFPTPQFGHPFFIVANLEARQRMGWSTVRGRKLLLHSFGVGGGEDNERAETKAALTRAVAFILRRDDFEIAAPNPEEPTLKKNAPPFCFLLTEITQDEYTRLLRQEVWSFLYVTFQVLEYAFSMPALIHSIRGISTKNGNAERAVWNAFQQPQFQDQLLHYAAPNPIFRDMSNDEIINTILSSLQVCALDVKSTGGIKQDVVNMYMMSPTLLANEWLGFKELVQNLTFFDPKDGTATPANKMECRTCHGADHPAGLCPFLSVPDWNGHRVGDFTRSNTNRPSTSDSHPLSQVDLNIAQQERSSSNVGRGRPPTRRGYPRAPSWRQ